MKIQGLDRELGYLFFFVEFEVFFVYLDNSPLSYACFANIFSKSVTRLLILFKVF